MQPHTVSPRLISVEPMIFFFEAIQGVLINLRTEYLESRFAESHNYTLPNIGSGNSTCGLNETNTTSNEIERLIQAETAIWILYLKDTSLILPMFTATILAAASDYIGRRPIFFIGALCHLLASIIFLLVSIFNLPLPLLIFAEVILGLGGDTVGTEAVSMAYMFDLYPPEKRMFRFVLVSMVMYIGFGVSQTAIGAFLQVTHSFTLSFSCAVIIAIINLLYVCIPYFIPETITRENIPKGMIKQLFLNYIRLFKKGNGKSPLRLVVTLASDFVYYFVHEAVFVLITIYGIAAPFCWTPMETGIYAVMVNMLPAICSLVVARFLSARVNNYWLLHVSYISAMSELLVTAWAPTSTVLLYAAPATGFIRTLAEAVYKGLLSTLVDPDQQGVLFGCQALVASLAKTCSPIVLNTTYAAFVKLGKPQYTFFMASGLLGIPMLLNGLLQVTETNGHRKQQPLLVEECDDGTVN